MKKIHMKKALQKNNNSKEQGNLGRLTQGNNSLCNKVQGWWHKSISLASNQGIVMASLVLEALKKKIIPSCTCIHVMEYAQRGFSVSVSKLSHAENAHTVDTPLMDY